MGILIVIILLFNTCLGFAQVYREEALNTIDLETFSKVLELKGYKGLIPIRGIIKYSMDDKAPSYYSLTCSQRKGGLVRVEIEKINFPIKELKIKIIK